MITFKLRLWFPLLRWRFELYERASSINSLRQIIWMMFCNGKPVDALMQFKDHLSLFKLATSSQQGLDMTWLVHAQLANEFVVFVMWSQVLIAFQLRYFYFAETFNNAVGTGLVPVKVTPIVKILSSIMITIDRAPRLLLSFKCTSLEKSTGGFCQGKCRRAPRQRFHCT